MNIIFGYLITFVYLILVLLITKKLKMSNKIGEELARKIVHVLVGFSWFSIYYFLYPSIHFLIPSSMFIILNYISYKKDIFSMERKENRNLGTVFYALSMTIISLLALLNFDFLVPSAIGFFCMVIGDGLTPYFSTIFKSRKTINGKTLSGSIAMFSLSFLVTFIVIQLFKIDINFFEIFIIALFSMFFELVGKKGLDNLYVPIGVTIISYFFVI